MLYNGKLIDDNQRIASGNNPGLLYGDGLFETILVRNGSPVLFDEHLQRLKKGISQLHLQLPVENFDKTIAAQAASLIKINKICEGRLRLTVFRGDEPFSTNNNGNANMLIQVQELPGAPEYNKTGLTLVVYPNARKSIDAFSQIKHNNFLPNVMGLKYANDMNANDALILNQEGRVCETCIANIWQMKDGIISTPSLNEGPVAGIMRKFLLDYFLEKNFIVEEKPIYIEELKNSEEVFISNSIKIINWVGFLGHKHFTNRFSSGLFTTLKNEYPKLF